MAAQAVFTNLYRAKYAKLAADNLAAGIPDKMDLFGFAVGEGGFVETPPASGNRFPKTPDPTKTDLEATGVNPPGNDQFRYLVSPPPEKALGGGNVTDDGAGVLTIVAKLASVEAGLDGAGLLDGSDPRLFEIGIFDEDGDLMIYGTFDEEIKIAGKAIDFNIVVTY